MHTQYNFSHGMRKELCFHFASCIPGEMAKALSHETEPNLTIGSQKKKSRSEFRRKVS